MRRPGRCCPPGRFSEGADSFVGLVTSDRARRPDHEVLVERPATARGPLGDRVCDRSRLGELHGSVGSGGGPAPAESKAKPRTLTPAVGADRVLLGTDGAFAMGPMDTPARLAEAGFEPATTEAVRGGNTAVLPTTLLTHTTTEATPGGTG
ncbi:hypothetical protein [Streptomyces pseudovenezuelae]|uniref:hypothetical protein n=1 Tax=Streptomyces pseudovenezuelae TaxID=67350 RepID=UPI00371C5F13